MRILLVEDNAGDIRLLREYLKEAGADRYQVTHADRLARGLERLAEVNVDAVLLDRCVRENMARRTMNGIADGTPGPSRTTGTYSTATMATDAAITPSPDSSPR